MPARKRTAAETEEPPQSKRTRVTQKKDAEPQSKKAPVKATKAAPAAPAAAKSATATAKKTASAAAAKKTTAKVTKEKPAAKTVAKGRKVLTEVEVQKPEVKKVKDAKVTKPKAKEPKEMVTKPKIPHVGLNPLPTSEPLPSLSSFSFEPSPASFAPAIQIPPSLFIFGSGEMGQLGMGDDADEAETPKVHEWFSSAGEKLGPKGVVDLECGAMHSIAIDSDGKIWTWGSNDDAALGRPGKKPKRDEDSDGDTNMEDASKATQPNGHNGAQPLPETEPRPVHGLHENGFKAVKTAAGDNVSVAINEHGELKAWGSFKDGKGDSHFDASTSKQFLPVSFPVLSKVVITQVACGDNMVVALATDGHVWTWGINEDDRLGRRVFSRRKGDSFVPTQIPLKNVVLIGCGGRHSFAVQKDGTVLAWGLNTARQTGISDALGGDASSITFPTAVEALHPSKHDGSRVVQIQGGEFHSLFLFDNGQVWGCGRCADHEIGLSEDHSGMIAAKRSKEENTALVRKTKEEAIEDVRKRRERGEDISVIDESLIVSDAVNELPTAQQWIPEPVKIDFPNETLPGSSKESEAKIVQISASSRHSLAISATGVVYGWGLNSSYALGLGDNEEIETPRRIGKKSLKDLRALKVGSGAQHGVIVASKVDAGKA